MQNFSGVVKFKYLRGDFLANIRFENLSGDTVIVIFNGNELVIENEARVSVDALEKGEYSLKVHRARVPFESEDVHENKNEGGLPFKIEKSMHTQLDLLANIELNASKAVVTVKTEVTSKERFGLDVIFSSYSVAATGAKIESERKAFANESVRKSFISHHIKNVFFPVGFGGICVLILGIFACIRAVGGEPVNIGGTEFTIPWSAGLTCVGAGFLGYCALCVGEILKTARKLKKGL